MDPTSLQKNDRQELRYNEELADFVNKEFERRRNERKPYELQWRLNMEFINGNQYLDIDSETMSIADVPRLYWYQEREVYNMIATISETRIARLSRQKPLMKVRPSSSEQNDLSAAKISSMLLTSVWHDEDLDRKYEKFIGWMEVCGTSFFKVIWNKNKGRILQEEVQEKDELEMKAESDGNKEEKESEQALQGNDPFQSTQKRMILREGDIDTEVVSPFEIYPDSSHGDFDDCRSVIHARAYHVDDIQDWWGVKVEKEKVDVVTLQNGASGMGGLGYSVGSFRYTSQSLDNYALLKEYYELPSIRYPYGRMIVTAGNKTLYAGVLPYQIGEDREPSFPFVRAASLPVVGCFWGKSVIERCIPIQRRYNAFRNRKAEYLNLVTIGQWYAPEGSVEDETVLNNEPGNIIRYRNMGGGLKPEPVVFPSLPQSFEIEMDSLMQEFTAVSGVSELSRFSEAPAGVKSGVALSIANEADDSRISMTANQINIASIDLGRMWLRLYRQFAQEPRLLRHVGNSSEIDLLYWNASDLRSDDVIIDNSSAIAETPSQRRQMVFDLMQTGIFNRMETNPFSSEGVRKIMEMLDLGFWEKGINDDEELQVSKAKRENRMMLEGTLVPPNDYDDDNIHIREHYRFMMTTDYEEILQTEEGMYIEEAFKSHIAAHHERVIMMMQDQIMMEAAPQLQQQQQSQGEQDGAN